MPDIYVDWCTKCGGRGELAIENGDVLIRCNKCGRSVTICREDELQYVGNGRKTVILGPKARGAFEKWNTKEEADG